LVFDSKAIAAIRIECCAKNLQGQGAGRNALGLVSPHRRYTSRLPAADESTMFDSMGLIARATSI
jgi:hypothetical protein